MLRLKKEGFLIEDMDIPEHKYERAPICWAILDIIQEFIENKKGNTFFISMEEIRNKIIACKFEKGLPELHQTLATTDPEFVQYIFGCAKGELQSEGFIFAQIASGEWKVTKPCKKA